MRQCVDACPRGPNGGGPCLPPPPPERSVVVAVHSALPLPDALALRRRQRAAQAVLDDEADGEVGQGGGHDGGPEGEREVDLRSTRRCEKGGGGGAK